MAMENTILLSLLFFFYEKCSGISRVITKTEEPYTLSCGINYFEKFKSCVVETPDNKIAHYPNTTEWGKDRIMSIANSTMC